MILKAWHIFKEGDGFVAKEHVQGMDGMARRIEPAYTGNYVQVTGAIDELYTELFSMGKEPWREWKRKPNDDAAIQEIWL